MLKMLLMLLFLGACGNNPKTVNLSYVQTPLNVPAIINVKENIFKDMMAEQGIQTEYLALTTGSQQAAALASGSIDIVPTMGDTSVITALANGAPIKIIGMFGRSPKAFVLAVKDPALSNIESLRGKKIGGPRGTVLNQLLVKLLTDAGMSINDVDFISMGVSESLPALLRGDIDGALLVGAASYTAVQNGAEIIATGEGLISGSTLIAARDEFVKNSPQIIKEFLTAQQDSSSRLKYFFLMALEKINYTL